MVSNPRFTFGMLACAAVFCGVLSGCGGSSSSVPGINISVPISGGVQNQGATLNQSVPSSTSPQQARITAADGRTQTVVIPPGESFKAGDQAVVLDPNHPILSGLRVGPQTNTQGGSQIFVDGLPSGVFLNGIGALTLGLLLNDGNHTLSVTGPFTITGTNSKGQPSTLTINNSIVFTVVVSGISASLPINLTGRLPGNGGSTANGNSVSGQIRGFPAGVGNFTMTWPGVTKNQKVALRLGTFTFRDPLSDGIDTIPTNGIDSLTFAYTTQ